MVTAAKAVLLAWFLATIALQFRFRAFLWLRRLSGPAGLLAGWNLFSPVPVVGDVLVDARGITPSGDAEEWRPVVHPTPRRWFDAVLCVERRATKAVFDAAVAVVHLKEADVAPEVLVTRRAYLTLLHLATEAADANRPVVQFRVVHVTYAGGTPTRRVVFESRPHRRATGRPKVLA